MLELLGDLIAHKAHADAAVLATVRDNVGASADSEVIELLHHILVANRFWLLSVSGQPFALDVEARRSVSLEETVQRYRLTHQAELEWLATATEADLARTLENPLIPGGRCSVFQAWIQVCLHSHGHRTHCAKLLRRCGSVPPSLDFISWRPGRPIADWDRRGARPDGG